MSKYISYERLTSYRQALHQIPELGFEEVKTQAYLLEVIKKQQSDFLTYTTWKTGILVRIEGYDPVKTVGYRADIDGLPMNEDTGLSFSSTHQGAMHACGHDLHMTIALGLIEHFSRNRPKDTLVFIFQPAEEGPGGAKPMLEAAEFKAVKPDEIYALHIAPELPVGTISTKPGILFANTSELFIDLHGKGGHAAFPHTAEDMVLAASHFVTQLQSIVARNVSPLDSGVVTIGKMEAGTKQNIIAEHARIEGTIRTLSLTSMQEIKGRIEGLLRGVEEGFRCQASIDYGSNYCQVYNDPVLTESFMEYARGSESVTFVEADKAMTGEDFGYFLEEIPGLMFWLGVDSEYGLHHNKLNPKEGALSTAVDFMIEYLSERVGS
ncbi:N-acetyldiaminopimelate deacetylase [Paenalkalicoccus suaedae]|uniref:N-acetyldiaminopimelate deacetylase n=1 Tax=Paenalkalicoccus suaedae TaxID=2592382 RepID=A0A859FHC4_9BACI|nr:N-acetyldiaminopimelate deacetylase [Paenalkalicoccus suaedae]QKS71586.1 N-acetyldiaminopimelate deacetylase [Paenalkalicoccus suaedae]